MKRIAAIIGVGAVLYWACLCYRSYYLDEAESLLLRYDSTRDPDILARLEIIEPKIETIMCHTSDDDRRERSAKIWKQINSVLALSSGLTLAELSPAN